MHEHPEDHDKIEKLKDLIAWQVKDFKSGWSGPTAVQRQFSVTSEKIQTLNRSPRVRFFAI